MGNKSDMVNERVVSEEMAKRFAKENSLNYIETSAKLGGVEGNIDKAFEMIVTGNFLFFINYFITYLIIFQY